MDIETLALDHQETKDRSLRNEGRIKKLEQDNGVLHELATAVAVMAERMKSVDESVCRLSGKVESLEAEPAKKWKFVVEKSIYIFVAAIGGFIIAKIGLG